MNNVLEVGSQHQEGAKINLTVDLAPGDCFVMCKQLFERLKDHEQKEIMDTYLKSKGITFFPCEDSEEKIG